MVTGGCRCGAVRYEAEGDIAHHALCHCKDCQMGSGAPMVAWIAFLSDKFRVTEGEPSSYNGAGKSIRQFCGTCGTPPVLFQRGFPTRHRRHPDGDAG